MAGNGKGSDNTGGKGKDAGKGKDSGHVVSKVAGRNVVTPKLPAPRFGKNK